MKYLRLFLVVGFALATAGCNFPDGLAYFFSAGGASAGDEAVFGVTGSSTSDGVEDPLDLATLVIHSLP
jgi:hypothetical protein